MRLAASRDEWWATQFADHGVKGILVNSQVDRKVDTLLTSLIAALVAYGGNSPRTNPEEPIRLPEFDDLAATLTLLARITLPLENDRALSPEEGARAIHAAMEEARHDTVRLLLSAISQYDPEEGELPQPYIARLSENLVFEYMAAEFAAGSITPLTVRPTIRSSWRAAGRRRKYSSSHSPDNYSSLARMWATEEYREKLVTRFWLELPPREKSLVLRGPDLWAVPVVALRQTLGNLAEAGADAPRREARHILLNYARRLEHEDWRARRSVAAGLLELCPIIESLWPNQFPEDLSRGALQALEVEVQSAGRCVAGLVSRVAEPYRRHARGLCGIRSHPAGVGKRAARQQSRAPGRVGKAHGGSGAVDAVGGRRARQSPSRSRSAEIAGARSGQITGPHDAVAGRGSRHGHVGGHVAFAAHHGPAGAQCAGNAFVRSAPATCHRGDQAAGFCRP